MTEPTSGERDEAVDRVLRDAGARLRASAPDEATTTTAWEFLDDRGAGRRRLWWMAPIVLAAAAASVLAVVVITRTDETVRDIPADTPAPTIAPTVPAPTIAATVPTPTSAAPATVPATTTAPTTTTTTAPTTSTSTSTITSTTTTTPPVAPMLSPAFVGELPLDASAAVLGCPGTLGDLAASIPEASWPIVGLACAGEHAVVSSIGMPDGTHYDLTWDGTWNNHGGGTAYPCDRPDDAVCAAFGHPVDLYDVSRPLPPAWLIEDPNYLAGVDVTDELTGLGLVVSGDAQTFADALGDELAAITPGDPIPRVETAVLDGVQAVTVTLSGIPDDSSSSATYVVRYADIDGELSPREGLLFHHCDRGGGAASGLCL